MREPNIALAFSYPKKRKIKPGIPVPSVAYDFEARRNTLTENLKTCCPGINFIPAVLHSNKDVESLVKRKDEFDGFLIYEIGLEYLRFIDYSPIAEIGKPVILVDDYLAGMSFSRYVLMRERGLPVVYMCSSRFQDVADTVKLFKVIKRMKDSKIMMIIDEDRKAQIFGLDIEEFRVPLKKIFGTEIVRMTREEFFKNYIMKASEREAEAVADRWMKDAERIVEPKRDEIVKAAKVYLALKKVIEEKKVEAISTDIFCGVDYYLDKFPDDVFKSFYPDRDPKNRGTYEYPFLAFLCMGVSKLLGEGFPFGCEMNLHAALNQLVMQYLTEEIAGEPRLGFTGGPLFDLGKGYVIYHLCTAPSKLFGTSCLESPYILRSEAECACSVAPTVLMPTGEKITSLLVDPVKNVMIIHQGIAAENIVDEKLCRNKLAIKTDVESLMKNYMKMKIYQNRTIFYGDWRKHLINLATLTGLEVFEEDKA